MTTPPAAARWRRWKPVGLLLVVIAAGAWSREARAEATAPLQSLVKPGPGYASSDRCRSCHPRQYVSWRASYHRRMTQRAEPGAVLAPFAGEGLAMLGQQASFHREGDDFVARIGPADADPGELARHRLALVTGSHHLQVYWYANGQDGLLEQLPFVYLLREQRWLPRPFTFLQPTPASIRPEKGRWNGVCLTCHTTDPAPQLSPDGLTARTRVSELGIACESCHGPAQAHVAAQRDPVRRYQGHLDPVGDEAVVNPADLSPARASEVCGDCHSSAYYRTEEEVERFLERGPRYRPGDVLADSRHVLRLGEVEGAPRVARLVAADPLFWENRFWPDGVMRVAGREYNGLLESPCAKRGTMTCLSCHEMHPEDTSPAALAAWADDQLGPGMRGDAACRSCHEAARYETRAHTHHAPESAGSRCYNCHMPYTSYGLLKAIRSHTVESPSATTSVATGRPNGCNQCHLDRSLGWAAQQLQAWYGQPMPPLSVEQQTVAASVLWGLRGDAVQRALVAWSMGWPAAQEASGTAWLPPYLAHLMLEDPFVAVRQIASRSLRALPGYAAFPYDPLAPYGERAKAAGAFISHWSGSRRFAQEPPDSATLVGASGLDFPRFETLAAGRDDRPLRIQE